MTSRSTEEHTSERPSAPRGYPSGDDLVGRGDGRPRWKTVLVIVVAVLVVAMFLALHLIGAVGPGAH